MKTALTRMVMIGVSALLMGSLAGCGCSKKEEPVPVPTPAQVATPAPEPEVKQPAIGDQYINAISTTHRVAAAAVAEKYIKDKTRNHLDSLVLNPKSKFWAFPEDLNEFNEAGKIIVFDAYVDGNKDNPYRIVLIRSSKDSDKWTVKRFGPDNSIVTDSKKSSSDKTDSKKSESKKSDSKKSN